MTAAILLAYADIEHSAPTESPAGRTGQNELSLTVLR
jgi:hypothetical protein